MWFLVSVLPYKFIQFLRRIQHANPPNNHKRKNLNRIASIEVFRGATGNRTRDTRIFSPLLYQLSYGTRLFVLTPYLSIGIAKVGIFS